MGKVIKIGMAGMFLASLVAFPLHAATVDTETVDVTATVTGVSSITKQEKNIDSDADATNDTDATGIAFGTITPGAGAWADLPGQYVRISVTDNSPSWNLKAYTDNFTSAPSTSVWGLQYGGLVSTGPVAGGKAPMGWMALPNTVADGPATGTPVDSTTNGWTFIKDSHDVDDPSTAANDESFAAADAAGFTTIAFGAAGFTNIVRPNIPTGSETLPSTVDPFYWYVEADFSGAAAADYVAGITLDLVNN